MIYGSLNDLLQELMAHPDELYVSEGSSQCAMYSTLHGAFLFLDGDFSGTEEEKEQEMDRIMNDIQKGRV